MPNGLSSLMDWNFQLLRNRSEIKCMPMNLQLYFFLVVQIGMNTYCEMR